MKFTLYQEIVLLQDIPDAGLRAGDVATLVEMIPHPDQGETGAILEIFNALGDSLRVVTVPLSVIAPLQADQVPAVRTLPHITA
jgi:hypothetical protein